MEKEDLIKYINGMKEEADSARKTRMDLNEDNFDMYHYRHNFRHKRKGQSREILSKQTMAVEQTASFFQQALVD